MKRLRAAAFWAIRIYPGSVGELLSLLVPSDPPRCPSGDPFASSPDRRVRRSIKRLGHGWGTLRRSQAARVRVVASSARSTSSP
jgi:hypothetical protein